jgi:Rieske Fe-S protein
VTEEATFVPVTLGPISRFTGEKGFAPTAATYVEDPAQPETSAGLAYVHHTGGASRDWLAPDAMFVVFSNRCTHVGCPVAATLTGFGCLCHGSVFDERGSRVGGPAIRPLDRFQWEIRSDDSLWIANRWSVLNHGDRTEYFPVKSPGQPLAGQIPAIIADTAYPAVNLFGLDAAPGGARPLGRVVGQPVAVSTVAAVSGCRDAERGSVRSGDLEWHGPGGPSGLQNRQAVVAPRLVGSTPAPLR